MLDENLKGCLSLLTKLFVKEAQYAQITRLEALDACDSVLSQFGYDKQEHKEYLFDTLIQKKVLIPLSISIYLVHSKPIQGILIDFTACYSPLCKTSKSPCYSPCCPNKLPTSHLTACSNDQSHGSWISKIPRYILNNLCSREKNRQLAIEELTDYESHFLKQLKVIQETFSYPLLLSQAIIDEPRKELFHNILFGNYQSLSSHHQKLTVALDNVRNSYFLFPDSTTIGHILYDHFSLLQDLYTQYVSNHARSRYIYTLEYSRNTAFSDFIQQQQAIEREIRLPLKDLLVSPIVRIGKYELLFTTIVKHSIDDDCESLHHTIRLVQDILHNINEAARIAEDQVRLDQIRTNLKLKTPLPNDATLLMEGFMDLIGIQPTPCHLFLFSHGLYVTRIRPNVFGETEYIVLKYIPLGMIELRKPSNSSRLFHPTLLLYRWHSTTTMDRRRSNNSNSILRRLPKLFLQQPGLHKSATYPPLNNKNTASSSHRKHTVLHLCHRADPHVILSFACETAVEWKKKIRSVILPRNDGPYALSLICSTFNYSQLQSVNGRYATGCGTIYCSLPFTTSDGRARVALGTQYGLWVASADGSEAFRQVLSASCHQLEFFQSHVLLVRCVHPQRIVGALLIGQSNTTTSHQVNVLQKSGVLCFATTETLGEGAVLVYLRKRRTGSYRLGLLRYVAMDNGSVPYFAKHKERKMTLLEPHDLKVVDECVYVRSPTEGVEKINLVPWILGSKSNKSTLIRLASTADDVVLSTVGYLPLKWPHAAMVCSTEYAHSVVQEQQQQGDVATLKYQQGIAFESKAKFVTMGYPYLIIFSSHVIEIRHLETSELVQVISGDRIRCTHVSHEGRTGLPIIHVSMVDIKQDKTHVYQLYLKEHQSSDFITIKNEGYQVQKDNKKN